MSQYNDLDRPSIRLMSTSIVSRPCYNLRSMNRANGLSMSIAGSSDGL